MINSIQNMNNNPNAFGDVTVRKYPKDYWLGMSKNQDSQSKDEFLPKDFKIITPEEARKTHNVKLIGLSIAGATVLTGAGIFFFLQGGPKGLAKNFQKLRHYLEKKLQDSKLTENGVPSPNKMYIMALALLNVAQHKVEAINNFTSFKDLVFKRIMGVTKLTGKIHDGITKLFEKIGRQSVVDSYKKTSGTLKEAQLMAQRLGDNSVTNRYVENITINGVTKTRTQWLLEARQMRDEISATYLAHFGKAPIKGRYHRVKKIALTLQAEFAKLKDVFWSKDVYNQFIADSKIVEKKQVIQKEVHGFRKQLTHSISDMANDSEDAIRKMTDLISFKDIDKIKHLRDIRVNIKKYAKDPVANAKLKETIVADMDGFVEKINESLKNKTIDNDSAQVLLSEMKGLKDSFVGFKQGKIEDVLDIYKNLLSKDDYAVLEKSYRSGIKSLDKAIKIENEDFVNKLRDLSLGSAPTDVLTILGSIGVLGYNLGKSDSNEQRASIALKYGIPALAGVGVSLICNAKLFAGSKALVIGSVSSLVLNKIGVLCDNALKKHREAKQA